MEKNRLYRICLLVKRTRAFGRELCEGVITYAQDRNDWELRFLNAEDLHRRNVNERHDGFIARVTSDKITRLLAATGKPVVDLFYDRPRPGFAIVRTRHETIGRLAAETLAELMENGIPSIRLDGARHLLSTTELSVTKIAALSGFSSIVYFMQSFAATFGETPGAWRQHGGIRRTTD